MSDLRPRPLAAPAPTTPVASATPACKVKPSAEAFPCDRCGAEMFRMHAVWRCPECGYKTDCCGW